MPVTVANGAAGAPLRRSDLRPTMAKASLGEVRKADPERELAGKCIERARHALGWSLDEFTAKLPRLEGGRTRDPRQVRRYETGEDPTPIHLFMQVPDFWLELVVQYARARRDDRLRVRRCIEIEDVA